MTDVADDVDVPGLKYLKTVAPTASATTAPATEAPPINSDLQDRITRLNEEWKTRKDLNPKGLDLPITSKSRTYDQEKKLYDAWIAGGKKGNLVAFPGTSKHESGDAFDLLPTVPNELLDKYDLHRPFGAKDPVHVELKPGTVMAQTDDIDVPGLKYLTPPGTFTTQKTAKTTPSITLPTTQELKKTAGETIYNPEWWAKDIAAKADVAYGGLLGAGQFVATPFAKAADYLTNSTAGTDVLNRVADFASHPVGKAMGITNDPVYQKEVATKILGTIAQYADKPISYIAEQTGLPKDEVSWYAQAAGIKLAPTVGKAISEGAGKVKTAAIEGAETVGKAKEQVQQQFKTLKETMKPEANPNLRSIGAAEADKVAVRKANAQDLWEPIDLERSQLTRDFADVNWAREHAKDPVAGKMFRDMYADQNAKVSTNFQKAINNTGAELTGIERSELGQKINDVVDTYKKDRYQKVSDAYNAADKAGETLEQVSYKPLLDYINNKRPTVKTQNPILSTIEEELAHNDPIQIREVLDKEGKKVEQEYRNGTINLRQFEDIRKLIAEETEQGTSNGFHGNQLRKTIDQLTANKGGELYKTARKLNTDYMTEFEDTPTVKNITALKKGTVDRVVPLEQLPEKLLLSATKDQVQQVFNTLAKAGPEGQQMINELRGVLGEHLRDQTFQGVNRDVHGNYVPSAPKLNAALEKLDKSGKLDLVFGKKDAERFRTLNEVVQDIRTVPEGSVNYSGTAANLKTMLADLAGSYVATGVPVPILTAAKYTANQFKTLRDVNRVKDFIDFGKTK